MKNNIMMPMRFTGYLGVGLICFLYWIFDSIWAFISFEYNLKQFIFREPLSYLDTFLLKVSPYQMVSRLIVVTLFAVLGILIVEFFIKKQTDEKKLRESEEKFRSVITNIEEIIFMTDKEGVFILSQGKGLAAIGKKPDEEVGKSVFELYKTCPLITQSIQKALDGESVTMEIDVNDIYFRNWYTPRKNQAGETIGVLGLSVNITEQKQAEKERERLHAKLTQMQKMQSIGSLAGGIAHDFNNILFPIMGMSEILLEDLPESSTQYENVLQILKAGKRGADLVRQILAFSRQTVHKKMPVQIQQVLKEVLKLSRSTIPSNIEIHHTIQADCSPVMADPTQIHQVAMNLITNAYHAVETTGGTISVALKEAGDKKKNPPEPGPATRRYAVLTVSDTGCGMEPELLDKIFDPYFTTKEMGKGTGLGLSVVFGIIEDHCGNIKVSSEPGRGTRFDVYLPLIEGDAETASSPEQAVKQTGMERILLIDDEEAVVKIEKQMLKRLGYHVMELTSSRDALKIFAQNPDLFDLIISDMTMPNMTGDRLAQEMIAVRADIPVIICTGYSTRISPEKATEIGIKGLLMKPVEIAEMAKMVRKVLDEAGHSDVTN